MSTQKAKFELFARLQAMGFTYEEAVSLRRIEMTLHRWAEAECNGEIQREEKLDAKGWDTGEGRPYRVYQVRSNTFGGVNRYPIADREAGALRRLAAIVKARNDRHFAPGSAIGAIADSFPDFLYFFHQTDPRGCMLYLVTRGQLQTVDNATIERHSGKYAASTEEKRLAWTLDQYHNHGLAVCC